MSLNKTCVDLTTHVSTNIEICFVCCSGWIEYLLNNFNVDKDLSFAVEHLVKIIEKILGEDTIFRYSPC